MEPDSDDIRVKVTDEKRRAYLAFKISKYCFYAGVIGSVIAVLVASNPLTERMGKIGLLICVPVTILCFIIRILIVLFCFLQFSLKILWSGIAIYAFLAALTVATTGEFKKFAGALTAGYVAIVFLSIRDREPR